MMHKRCAHFLILLLLASELGVPAQASEVQWNRLVVQAHKAGNPNVAERLYLSALNLVPNDDDPRKCLTVYMLAKLYFERNLFESARPLFLRDMHLKKPLGESFPGLVHDLLPLATIEIAAGHSESAEKYLNLALKIAELHEMTSEEASALLDLGRIYLARGNKAESDRICRLLEALQSTPKTASACISLADTYIERREYDTAARLYETAARCNLSLLLRPDEGNFFARGFINLARIYLLRNDYASAEKMLRKALALASKPGISCDRTEADVNSWLAIALIQQKRTGEALPYLNSAIAWRQVSLPPTPGLLRRESQIRALIQNKSEIPSVLIKSGL